MPQPPLPPRVCTSPTTQPHHHEEVPLKRIEEMIRELTNKNKHVFKRTHVCLCAYLCAVSISVFKSVFFCHINIWFG